MRVIRLDVKDGAESAVEFHEITRDRIVMTDTYGAFLLQNRGWFCDRLILIGPESYIQISSLNAKNVTTVSTIKDGLTAGFELGRGVDEMVIVNYHHSSMARRVLNICQQASGPRDNIWHVRPFTSQRGKFFKHFFHEIKDRRGELFKDVAQRMGIKPKLLSHYINGKLFPVHEMREKLAHAFGIEASQIHDLFKDYHQSAYWFKH